MASSAPCLTRTFTSSSLPASLEPSGLGRKEAKLIFVWSQAMVSDELKKRKRAVGLMFFDFVEV
jgi:hypothetical protein